MLKELLLPETNVKSAKERLEEITKDGDIKVTKYVVLGLEGCYYESFNGECRAYDDGFEARYGKKMEAFLHIKEDKINGTMVYYKFRESEEE